MYSYEYDSETGGIILNSSPLMFSKEPRPVYYKELDILGFNKYWKYPNDDNSPIMWAEANNYYYRGRKVAQTKGGSLYTEPELIICDEPEPEGATLKVIDITAMVAKNNDLLTSLAQETIKKVYNYYSAYKEKVDIFYVAFSGGKDSIVALDIVQRALNHSDFRVVFGDTGMENCDTYNTIEHIRKYCEEKNILFSIAQAKLAPTQSWKIFGPPAVGNRWCCGVHKTSPQIELLRKVTGKKDFVGMAFTGVRGDESTARGAYEEVSMGRKHHGQFSCHPILEWNSAELYLYIYQNNLIINEAYKKGCTRVGCLVCPMSTGKHEFIKRKVYGAQVEELLDVIRSTSVKTEFSNEEMNDFINHGYWRARKTGRELIFGKDKHSIDIANGITKINLYVKLNDRWKEWSKTIGNLIQIDDDNYRLEFMNKLYDIAFQEVSGRSIISFPNCTGTKQDIRFISLFRSVIVKSLYCVNCGYCEAECPFGCISMTNGLHISDECRHCHKCHDMYEHCLRYNSIRNKIGEGSMQTKSSDKQMGRFYSFGIKGEWLNIYFKYKGLNEFWENDGDGVVANKKKQAFLNFLRDADVLVANKKLGYDLYTKNELTKFGSVILDFDSNEDDVWALLLCNLAYKPDFNWYVKNVPFYTRITQEQLLVMLESASDSSAVRKNVKDAYKFMLITTPLGENIGLASCDYSAKNDKTGQLKINLEALTRYKWETPNPLVVLYSLFKFAEACGKYYDFTLSRLMDFNIESDGISPAQIFGIEKDEMKRILNGLAVNYPEFINVTFTLDLESISLRDDKGAEDVLDLFKGM